MNPSHIRIDTIEQLQKECGDGEEFFILLKGSLRSSKNIAWLEDCLMFSVFNEIDGTFDKLTPQEIMDENYTNIGSALKKGALYKYNHEVI